MSNSIMELKFLENIQVELEFHEFEFFEWNSSSTIYLFIFKFHLSIIRLAKNQVSKQGHIPK